ncbi:MAG: Calx-beta domain-containing protein [Gaiellaceae bacterium]
MRLWLAAGVAVLAVSFVAGASGDAKGAPLAVPVANPYVSAAPDVIVGEADGFADVTVTLSAPGLNSVAVSYDTAAINATQGTACDSDYVRAAGTLTFLPGEISKVVHIQIVDCAVLESPETFRFFLFSNNFIARGSTLITIVDNDTVVPAPSAVVRDVVVDEQSGNALVTVLLGGFVGKASASPATVDYATSDGAATSGADYTAVNGTLTFAAGQVVKTVLVPILDDVPAEPAESFSFNLSNPSGATIGDAAARVLIGPSDAPATGQPFVSIQPDVVVGESDGFVDLTLSLSAPGLNPDAVSFSTSDATAIEGESCDNDYVRTTGSLTFLPGETTKVVRVQILDCPVTEGLETFTLFLFSNNFIARSSVLVTIVDRTITLNSIAVSPPSPAVPKGLDKQLTVTGNYSNAATIDLTSTAVWTSSTPANATVTTSPFTAGGLVHAANEGTSTITATLGALSDSTLVTVGAPVLASITVNPPLPTIPFGTDQQFSTTGIFTDGSTNDLPSAPTWLSATLAVATINAAGLAHPTGVGTSTISASLQGITGSTTLTVGKANQTITFAQPADRTFGDADFAAGATSTSNLAVGFSPSGSCTVSGTTVHITGAGSCTITASQTGNVNYNGATSVPRTFQIAKANQAITVNTHAPLSAAGGSSFSVSANAAGGSVSYSSAGACTNSGSFFTTTSGGGTCTVRYDQLGNTNFNAAPQVTENVGITAQKQEQTITFGALSSKTFGDADFSVSATASSGLAVSLAAGGNCTITGAAVHIAGAGSCTVTASQDGNAAYNAAAAVARTFTIAKASQTITFAALSDKKAGDADFGLGATASSGLAVSYTASGNCTVSGATAHITAAGSCTITAAQAGNANYNAASTVARSFTIDASLTPPAPPPPTCTTPKLSGQTLAAAKQAIVRAGCSVGNVTYTYSTRKKGTVVSQSRSGTYVDIVISSGPLPKALAEAVITGRCNRITARLLLARFRLGDLGDPKLRDPVSQVLCGAFAGKRSRAMAVTLAIPACGRTGGWVVFRWNGRAWKVLLKQKNGADLAAVGTTIRETMFVFKSGDKHCSPTGGTRSRVWHWTGRRLAAGPWKSKR